MVTCPREALGPRPTMEGACRTGLVLMSALRGAYTSVLAAVLGTLQGTGHKIHMGVILHPLNTHWSHSSLWSPCTPGRGQRPPFLVLGCPQ